MANTALTASSREHTSALPALATQVTSTATHQAEAAVAPRETLSPLVFQATVCFWVWLELWQRLCTLCNRSERICCKITTKNGMIKYRRKHFSTWRRLVAALKY